MSRYYVQLVLRYLCSKGRKRGQVFPGKDLGPWSRWSLRFIFVKTAHSETNYFLIEFSFSLRKSKKITINKTVVMESLCWQTVNTCGLTNLNLVIFFGDISQTFGACVLVDGSHENAGNKAKFAGTIIFVVKFSQHSWDANHFVPEGEDHLKRWRRI